jgi:hypothetical protein
MCRSILFALFTVLAVPCSARAQISVQLRMERDTLMLFESIPVIVTVRNFSGHTIDLANQGEAPWLNFLITDVAGATISPVGNRPAPDPVKIAPGRTVSVAANLLPHYDLRQRGIFIVRAVVEGEGIHALSAPTSFTIIHGREIWRQTIGLPRAEGETNEEYRTYSLLLRRAEHNEVLYAGVQDEAHDLIYGMISLGDFIELGEPSARADNTGNLHVLYRSGPRSIGYAEIAPDAKVVKHVVYSDILSVPQLVAGSDGAVTVHGGEQVYPHLERVMTNEELKPRPPPPAKPPKKKWWRPFSPNKPQSPATNTASSASATNAPSANFGPRS